MSFSQAASYIWIGQAMLAMLPWNIEQEIGQTVRTGQVAYELARPLGSVWHVVCPLSGPAHRAHAAQIHPPIFDYLRW